MRVSLEHAVFSLSTKINLALLLVFITVMISSALHTASSEQNLIEQIIKQQTIDTGDSYFDAINTMMLTGSMDQRNLLRDKLLARPNVTEARIIRGDAIKDLYGKGLPEEQVADEWDRRALNGEDILHIRKTPQGRILTAIKPILASENYRGTNCLSCHSNAASGSVVGAVRISYSLDALDRQVTRNLWTGAGINAALFSLGLLLMVYISRRILLNPLKRLRNTVDDIEKTANLNRRVEGLDSNDEIGLLGRSFNRMLERFRDSLQRVADSAREQRKVAECISSTAKDAARETLQQQTETKQLASAMNQMNSAVHDVARNAAQTAEASQTATEVARNGAYVSTQALAGIDMLAQQIEQVGKTIRKLDTESAGVGSVLDVIKDISEQTNLLALNAAIEAARAGETGRGFAVVADEVRTLANRSHGSAAQIQQMIESLQAQARGAVKEMEVAQEKAQEGTELVEQAAESLGLIAGEVSAISDRNTEVAASAEEQSAVANEINLNAENINLIADKTSAGARQTARDSSQLLELALQLESMAAEFKVS